MIPIWLHVLSVASLVLGFACAGAVLTDVVQRPQHMAVMNVVWPVTALFGTVFTVWGYLAYGRLGTHEAMAAAKRRGKQSAKERTPFWATVGKGASHCGAGCALGDICAEWLCFVLPSVAVWFGWRSLFAERMYAVWVVDFVFAFAFGIAFQYFAIKPMQDVSVGQGIVQALKADALSLASWQVGMYGVMAFAGLYLFPHVLRASLRPDSAEFWFVMQVAMLFGFATAYPVNWWLIRTGVKEAM